MDIADRLDVLAGRAAQKVLDRRVSEIVPKNKKPQVTVRLEAIDLAAQHLEARSQTVP